MHPVSKAFWVLLLQSIATSGLVTAGNASEYRDLPSSSSSAKSSPSSSSHTDPANEDVVRFLDTGNPNIKLFVGLIFPKDQIRAGSWLAANLVSMANGTKSDEFLKALGVAAKSNLDSESGKDRPSNWPLEMMNEAACEPEMRTIDLSEYTFTAHDPDIAVYPRCIRVPRCGGCCGPSSMIQCKPTRVAVRDVAVRKWSVTAKNSKKGTTQEFVPIEYHESCSCQCRIQEKDCDPLKQRYSEEKCKCLCLSTKQHKRCVSHPDKVWNPSDCTCRCRSVKKCSTGFKMSPDSCACEEE